MTSRIGARRLLLVAAAIAVLCAFPAIAAAHAELVRAASPTPATTPSQTPSASPTPSADPGTPTSSTTDVLLPIIAALAIVLVLAGFLLSRSRAGR